MRVLVARQEGGKGRGTHDIAVQRLVLCRYHLEEILEHIVRRFGLSRTKINISRGATRSAKVRWNVGANMRVNFVKWVPIYSQNLLDVRIKDAT